MPLEQVQHLLLVYVAYLIAVARTPAPARWRSWASPWSKGRASAITLARGMVTGTMFWAILAATGISTILTAWASAIFAIKVAGGLYLL